jgi:hypothetical protein
VNHIPMRPPHTAHLAAPRHIGSTRKRKHGRRSKVTVTQRGTGAGRPNTESTTHRSRAGAADRTPARDGTHKGTTRARHSKPITQERRTDTESTTSINTPSSLRLSAPRRRRQQAQRRLLTRRRALPQLCRLRLHPQRSRPKRQPLAPPPQPQLRRRRPMRAPALSLRARRSSTARR